MLYAYLTSLFWGISSVVYAELLTVFSPMLLFLLQGVLFAGMAAFLYVKEWRAVQSAISENRTYLLLAVATLALVILAQFFFYRALAPKEGGAAAHKSIAIAYTAPLVSLLILWMLQKETITWLSFAGVFFVVIGIGLIAWR